MALPSGRCWRATGSGIVLSVRLTPRSSCDAVEGLERQGTAQFLKARVRAVADKGKANAALEKLIAGWIGVPRSRVKLERGGKSRLKVVSIAGDTAELEKRLNAVLSGLQ